MFCSLLYVFYMGVQCCRSCVWDCLMRLASVFHGLKGCSSVVVRFCICLSAVLKVVRRVCLVFTHVLFYVRAGTRAECVLHGVFILAVRDLIV